MNNSATPEKPASADVLQEYIKQVHENIEAMLKEKELAKQHYIKNNDGSYLFTIEQTAQGICEKKELTISKALIDALCSYHSNSSSKSALELEQASIIRRQITPGDSQEEQILYYLQNKDKINAEVEDKLLHLNNEEKEKLKQTAELNIVIGRILAPALANRGINQSVRTAYEHALTDSDCLDVMQDKGYCTKALTLPLYELQNKYGGLKFLPEDIEKAAHPQTFSDYIPEQYLSYCVDLSSAKQMQECRQGDLVIVEGHHLMFFDGIKDEKPQYIGFNNDTKDFSFLRESLATVIHTSRLIDDYPPEHLPADYPKQYHLGQLDSEDISIPVLKGFENQKDLFQVHIKISRTTEETKNLSSLKQNKTTQIQKLRGIGKESHTFQKSSNTEQNNIKNSLSMMILQSKKSSRIL
ncbi:MAG: hypothetical protein J6W11_00590 [Alphaproteobacteria bacterium]|nr:hypothetical protein [Alphaproteobacteria bacterium]